MCDQINCSECDWHSPRCGLPTVLPSNIAVIADRWHKQHITWRLHRPVQRVSQADQEEAIRAALRTWGQATGLHFYQSFQWVRWWRILRNVREADIYISAEHTSHGDGHDFTPNILAHAFGPFSETEDVAGDVHFNDEFLWTLGTQEGWFDFETVARHELGHALGFGHNNDDPDSIMWPYYKYGRALSAGDVERAQGLYKSVR